MAFFNLYAGGVSEQAVDIQGNGILANNEGQLVGRSIIAKSWPIAVRNGEGITGNPMVSVAGGEFIVGMARGLNGNIITDQLIEIAGPEEFIVTKVIAFNASGSAAMTGIITTLPSTGSSGVIKNGLQLSPAQSWSSLVAPGVSAGHWDVPINKLGALRVPRFYLSFPTPEGLAFTFDLAIVGLVTMQQQDVPPY